MTIKYESMLHPHFGQTDDLIGIETDKIVEQHVRFASSHEFFGVVYEELMKFLDSVRANEPDVGEVIQMAASCRVMVWQMLQIDARNSWIKSSEETSNHD